MNARRNTSSNIVRCFVVLSLLLTVFGCGRIKRAIYAPDDRDEWQQPARVVGSLAIAPGQQIADVGAGGGYFTFLLADAAGDSGKVYAVDVDSDMTEFLAEKASQAGYTNVEVILAEPSDPQLPERTLDLVFTCNTYHHIEDRVGYFETIARSLRPGGRVAIVELKPEGWFQRIFPHSSSAEMIRDEMTSAGYRLLEEHDYLERQYFQIYAREAE